MLTTLTIQIPERIGLKQWVNYIGEEWYKKSEEDLRYTDVREIFSDHIIVARGYGMNAKMYKVPYETLPEEEGGYEIEFYVDKMAKVELKTEWVEKSLAIKAIGDNKIGGYGLIWGDENKKDLHGEWFSKETDELTIIFEKIGTIPVLFHHAIDDTLKTSVIAKIDKMEKDDIGLWWEARIVEHELYKDYIQPLLSKKMLYSSSGTFPGARRADKSTKMITRWPICEMTMTHQPAEYRLLDLPLGEIKKYYNSLGFEIDDLSEDIEPTNKNESVSNDVESEPVDIEDADVEDTAEEIDTSEQEIELLMDLLELDKLELELDLV